MRADLNGCASFVEVLAHGGFAPACRTLCEPKSKLGRRFHLTQVGQSFRERCRAMPDEAQQAEGVVAQARSAPHGRAGFSCPTGLVEAISPILTRYPKVRLQLDRAVDLIEERIDLALRLRAALSSDIAALGAGRRHRRDRMPSQASGWPSPSRAP